MTVDAIHSRRFLVTSSLAIAGAVSACYVTTKVAAVSAGWVAVATLVSIVALTALAVYAAHKLIQPTPLQLRVQATFNHLKDLHQRLSVEVGENNTLPGGTAVMSWLSPKKPSSQIRAEKDLQELAIYSHIIISRLEMEASALEKAENSKLSQWIKVEIPKILTIACLRREERDEPEAGNFCLIDEATGISSINKPKK